jgi:tRNA pseudouridine32 synthase / 23S rRNA pseudouridine746 synthase
MKVDCWLCFVIVLHVLVYIVGSLTVDAFTGTLSRDIVSIKEGDMIATIHNLTQKLTTELHPQIGLPCPSTNFAPSQFRSADLRVSFNCPSGTSFSMLPIQLYHMKRASVKPSSVDHSVTTYPIKIPSLDFVFQDQHHLNLSVSSSVLLQQYQEEQKIQAGTHLEQDKPTTNATVNPISLLNKIQTEHQASQPLSKEMLQILYYDEHICVVNKPSGVLSVPGPRRNPSLANLVYDTLQPPSIDVDQTVIHRLDMATSGILVYALSSEALIRLHDDFKERRVYKLYQALVHGHNLSTQSSSLEGEIDVALERDPNNPPFMRVAQHYDDSAVQVGKDMDADQNCRRMQHKFWRESPKPCLTQYRILRHETRNGNAVTRMEMKPLTGRTHQLRVHTAQVLRTPIVGDDIYGSVMDGPLCLHAQKLCIRHPISRAPMIFQADAPF